jgi:hypothetical protein
MADDDLYSSVSRLKCMRLSNSFHNLHSRRYQYTLVLPGDDDWQAVSSYEKIRTLHREYLVRDWILRFLKAREKVDNRPTDYNEHKCLICGDTSPLQCKLAGHEHVAIDQLKEILTYLKPCRDCGVKMFDEWSLETFVENLLRDFTEKNMETLIPIVHDGLKNLEDDYYYWLEEHEKRWCKSEKTDEQIQAANMESVD